MKARVLAGWPTPPDSPQPGHPGFTHAGAGPSPYLAAVAFPMEVDEPGDTGRPTTVVLHSERDLDSWARRRFLFFRVIDLEVPFAAVARQTLRIPDDAMREAGRHVALAIQLLMPHRPIDEVREAIAGLRDGIMLHVEDAFPVTVAITESREGPDWSYRLEHPDGRTIPLEDEEDIVAVAERLRPEDFRGLVSGRDILCHARGVILPAAARHGATLHVRSWPPPVRDL